VAIHPTAQDSNSAKELLYFFQITDVSGLKQKELFQKVYSQKNLVVGKQVSCQK
jgi:hypothetical protein